MANLRLRYPVQAGPYISQRYGENPDIYKKFGLKGHEGLDCRAPVGTEIIASADGFAVEVGDQGTKGYGKYIKLRHDFGETVYAHLQKFAIKQGEQVKAGQTIGYADSTGFSTASHLHFGLRVNPYNRNDGWLGYSDPEPYLFGQESEQSLPVWLISFLTENQIEVGKAESAIRAWADSHKQIAGIIENLNSYKNFIDDLQGQIKAKDIAFPELLSRAAQLKNYEATTQDVASKYANFVAKTASAISTENKEPGWVLNALQKFVMQTQPVNLTSTELILLGLKKFFENLKK